MQTNAIASPALTSPSSSNAAARSEQGGTPFDQVLSQEVAGRQNAEAPRASEKGSENTSAPQARGTDKETQSQPAAEQPAGEAQAAETQAAVTAPADLLALVANVAQLQNGEAGAEAAPGEEALGFDQGAGRKRASPFASIHAALGGRANHGAQAKPDGTWAAQVERGTSTRIDAGKADPVLSAQDSALAATKAGAAGNGPGTDFSAVLKEAGQVMQPLQQQAAVQQTAAQSALGTDKLAPRVGTTAWDQALGQKVVWMVNGEQQSASLTLNPPELGPLKVVLQVTNNQANATFVAAQPEVRQALEAAMPKLRDMLGDAGIQLGQASVDSGSPQEQHPAERQMRAQGKDAAGNEEAAATTATTMVRPSAAGLGLVDTFA